MTIARKRREHDDRPPAGESIVQSVGAFPSVVLAEGDYTAVAKQGNRTFQTNFSVVPGLNRDIEVLVE